MTAQRLSDRRDDDCDALLEQHSDRVAAGASDPPLADALAVWRDRLASHVQTTITLDGAIHGDQIALTPVSATDQVVVRGNEIRVGGHHSVLHPVIQTESS